MSKIFVGETVELDWDFPADVKAALSMEGDGWHTLELEVSINDEPVTNRALRHAAFRAAAEHLACVWEGACDAVGARLICELLKAPTQEDTANAKPAARLVA